MQKIKHGRFFANIVMQLLLLSFAFTLIRCEDGEHGLTVEPVQIAIEVNDSANVTCTLMEGTTLQPNETIIWRDENGVYIPQINNSKVAESEGTLILTNVDDTVKGEYTCTTTLSTYNSTTLVKVYIMPSYFTEGMVILGINAALILIFIACGTYRFIETRREKQIELKKEKRRTGRL